MKSFYYDDFGRVYKQNYYDFEKNYSRIEIANYLRDYKNLIAESIKNPKKTFWNIYTNNLKKDNRLFLATIQHYQEMIQIYKIFLLIKLFSSWKDFSFENLKSEDIDKLFNPENIFFDENNAKKFNKNQILNYIRNALNHSDTKELYKIKKLGNIFCYRY